MGPFSKSETLVLSRAVLLEVQAQAQQAVAEASWEEEVAVDSLPASEDQCSKLTALVKLPPCNSCFLPPLMAIRKKGSAHLRAVTRDNG